MKKHKYAIWMHFNFVHRLVISLFFTGFVLAYWLFLGSGSFAIDSPGTLRDAQWWQINSLLSFRAHIGDHGLGGDAMVNWRGETIAYWLPLPGLVRFFWFLATFVPLKILVNFELISSLPPVMYFSTISMVTSYAISIYFSLKLMILIISKMEARDVHIPSTYKLIMFLCVIFLNPYWFLFPSTAVYYETIAWGVSMATATTYFFVRQAESQASKDYLFFALFVFLTCFTRLIEMVFVLLLSLVVGAKIFTERKIDLNKILSGMIISLGAFLVLALNKARWNSWFTFIPIENHIATQSDPKRLSTYLEYGSFELQRILPAIDYYLFPSLAMFTGDFPFVRATNNHLNYAMKTMDYVEPKITVWIAFPVVAALTIFTLCYLARKCIKKVTFDEYRIFLQIGICAAASLVVLLVPPALTARYLGDWLILFLPFAFLGIAFTSVSLSKIRVRNIFLPLTLLTLSILQFVFNIQAYDLFQIF